MKTSVELPDALVKEAKKFAIETDTTLRDLIEHGLRQTVAGRVGGPGDKPVSTTLDDIGRGQWKGVQPDKYVASLRKDWK